MNRQQKNVVVESLRDSFSQSGAAFVVGYSGLTVKQVESLRNDLRQKKAKVKVAKARLMKRAVDGMDFQDALSSHLKNQIAIVFADGDISLVAKTLHEFSKSNQALELIAGCVDNTVLSKNEVIRIGSLPSREVLLAQVCGTLQAPMSSTMRVLNILILRLLWALKKIEEQKQQ